MCSANINNSIHFKITISDIRANSLLRVNIRSEYVFARLEASGSITDTIAIRIYFLVRCIYQTLAIA